MIIYLNNECILPRNNTSLKVNFNKTKLYDSLTILIVSRAKIKAYFYFYFTYERKLLKDLIITQCGFASN